jgi:hypothetical protein
MGPRCTGKDVVVVRWPTIAAVVVLLSSGVVQSASAGARQGDQPENTSRPTITGAARDGETLTAHNGSWSHDPTSFSYQWLRCDRAGRNCNEVGENERRYRLRGRDVGARVRVEVRAGNQFGSNPAVSRATAVVGPRPAAPANTAPPTINRTPQEGQTLVANPGSWANAPTRFSYRWSRCDSTGNECATLGGGSTRRLSSADVGRTIRLTVWATNRYGTSRGATSVPTATVSAALPSGAIKLRRASSRCPSSRCRSRSS